MAELTAPLLSKPMKGTVYSSDMEQALKCASNQPASMILLILGIEVTPTIDTGFKAMFAEDGDDFRNLRVDANVIRGITHSLKPVDHRRQTREIQSIELIHRLFHLTLSRPEMTLNVISGPLTLT